jgi:hypothetical protein
MLFHITGHIPVHVTGHIPDPSLLGTHIAAEQVVSQQLQDAGSTLFAVRRTARPGVFLLIEAEDLRAGQHGTAAVRRPI